MWTIRQEQLQQLRASSTSRSLDERVEGIHEKIDTNRNRTSEDELGIIRETVKVAIEFGIEDFDDQYLWSVRRLATGQMFWKLPIITGLLGDRLIHPKAKARYALLLSALPDSRSRKSEAARDR